VKTAAKFNFNIHSHTPRNIYAH